MKLFEAFQPRRGDIIAIVGGGGKTSLMYALGREALSHGLRPVLTTTTKLLPPADCDLEVVLLTSRVMLHRRSDRLPVCCSGFSAEGKLLGLQPEDIPLLLAGDADVVIVEADGSAGRPFKAPGLHEPVIPPSATIVVPVVGIDCLGRPLTAEFIHRPERVTELTGLPQGQPVTPRVVAQVLSHPLGYGGNLPKDCRWFPFINKIARSDQLIQAREIAQLIIAERSSLEKNCTPSYVVLGAVQSTNPVLELVDFSAGFGV